MHPEERGKLGFFAINQITRIWIKVGSKEKAIYLWRIAHIPYMQSCAKYNVNAWQ